MKQKHFNLSIALCLILMTIALRVLPHPANFAPVAAAAIFGGAVLPRKLGLWVPLAAMLISDIFIGSHDMIAVVAGCYILIALASSHWLKNKPSFLRGASLTLSGSIFFFVVTNFAVWLTSGMYTLSLSGLARCYYMGLPFFRGTALGDIFYTAALFGVYWLAVRAGQRFITSTSSQKYLTS